MSFHLGYLMIISFHLGYLMVHIILFDNILDYYSITSLMIGLLFDSILDDWIIIR